MSGNLGGFVGRTVIGDNNSQGLIGLPENTVERFAQVSLSVVNRNNAGYQRSLHGLSVRLFSAMIGRLGGRVCKRSVRKPRYRRIQGQQVAHVMVDVEPGSLIGQSRRLLRRGSVI